ncbi:MAG TPA: hypothetical protein VNV38_01610 [Stellaceae bacterium]|nr:hypothetical protein [Stellaceae bacterium]
MRRIVIAFIVIGAAGYAAINPGVVDAFYRDIYPSDPAKAQALDMCFVENHEFNRLNAGQRDACYQRMLQRLGEITPADRPNVNPIDLQRAAAQGSMPKSDIIRLQQNQIAAAHLPH